MAPYHPSTLPPTSNPPQPAPQCANTASGPSTDARDKALSKPPTYYEQKSRKVHAAIKEIWSGASFTDVARKYNQSPEALAVAFAVFGKEAFDIAEEKGVYPETAYRAMSLMKDGYDASRPMSRALPLAISQKRDEMKGTRREEGRRRDDDAGSRRDEEQRREGEGRRDDNARGRLSESEAGKPGKIGKPLVRSGGKGFETVFYGRYGGTGGMWKGKKGGV